MGVTRAPKRRWAPSTASVVVVAGSATGLTTMLWHSTARSRIDLHIYFAAVKSAFPGHLYDFHFPPTGLGFAYPPFAALVLKPLTALSFGLVDHVWLVGTVLASVAFLALAARRLPAVPAVPGYRTVLVAACLWTAPIFLTARIGQINAYLALAVLVDFEAARQKRPWAGVLTGLAAALKLTPAVAVIAMLACGYYRAATRAALAAAAVTLLAAAAAFHDSWRYWTKEVFDTHRVGGLDSGYSNSVRRLITTLHISSAAQSALWLALALALVAVAFVRGRRAAAADNPLAALVIAMCCGLAITPITWSHHLYFLVLALPLVLGDGRKPARVVAAVLLAALLFELHNAGQNTGVAELRAVVLPLLVLALPIDRPRVVPAPTTAPVQS